MSFWTFEYSGRHYSTETLRDALPIKDAKVTEFIRGEVFWCIWKERNNIRFQNAKCKSLRSLGTIIISFALYWASPHGDNLRDLF